MNIIIPARGGSQRIPGKNIKDFHGKPIIAYSIELMLHYPGVTRLVVSTDSSEIARVARDYGADVVRRSPDMAVDEVGTQEVAQGYLKSLSSPHPVSMVLYATAPMITVKDVGYGLLQLLYEQKGKAYCYTTDTSGNDVGGFYLGRTADFIAGTPLEGNSSHIHVDDIDINTPEDWERAERLYEEMQREQSGRTVVG